MAPFGGKGSDLLARADSTSWASSAEELKQQWIQPSDVFSVLLLLGSEVVNRALAQLAGGMLTPVTFSFGRTQNCLTVSSLTVVGWASYAITLLLASVGDARLMPASPDGSCLAVHGKSGYVRNNSSWVIGRIMRDYDLWMHPAVNARLNHMLSERHKYMQRKTKAGIVVPRPDQTGLWISVYEPSKTAKAGTPQPDLVYWSGRAVALIQLAISAIPLATSHDWCILMITVGGTVLALVTGSLPHWKKEKWSCRRSSHSTYVVTRGDGSQHAIVVLGSGHGLNLEDLAVAGQLRYPSRNGATRISLAIVCLLWISLLVTAAGVKTRTWYLLAVGGIGIMQNVLVAGWRRDPSALGLHLDFREVTGEMETMKSLLALEAKYKNVGKSLLPIFFPGPLLPHQSLSWEALTLNAAQNQQAQLHASNIVSAPHIESWTAHARTFGRV